MKTRDLEPPEDAILAFHLHNGYLSHGDRRAIRTGRTLSVTGELKHCSCGLHASESIYDAMSWWIASNTGSPEFISVVRVWDTIPPVPRLIDGEYI